MGELVLIRHGETEWSRTHRHTGRTDVPLTPYGEQQARALGPVVSGIGPVAVWTSPLVRASRTATLAGVHAQVDDDLVEWDNGSYEERTTADIRSERPGWWLWTDGAPGGETAADVGARCARTLERVAGDLARGDVVLFGHGHSLRVLAAVWLGLPPSDGGLFTMEPAAPCRLGTYRDHRVVTAWNDVSAHPVREQGAP